MFNKPSFTVFMSLGLLGTLQADTATLELRYLPVSKFLEVAIFAVENAAKGTPLEKMQTSSEVTLNGTKLEIDERANTLTVYGEEASIKMIKELAKTCDFAPIIIQLEFVRLRVSPPDGKTAADLLGKGEGSSPGHRFFDAGEKVLENLLQKAKDSGQVQIESNSKVLCTNNEAATFTSSNASGETFKAVVRPLANSKDEISVEVSHTNKKEGANSTLNLKSTIPNGAVILTGGLIEQNTSGNKVESVLLLKASITKS